MEGFFDLQVNGYGGVDFNSDRLTAEQLHRACGLLAKDGVAGVLATFGTHDPERMGRRMQRLATLRERDKLARRMIAGIHIEGPFLNGTRGYRGAHDRRYIRPASVGVMDRLLDAAGGLTRLVTLAPERDRRLRVTRMLAERGITVSAGHSNATLRQLSEAIDAGLSMFTHLGNGCPDRLRRHENIIQRVLSLHERLWMTFIADGVHIALPALGNYLRAAGLDRAIVVTDAVTPAGLGPGVYKLHGVSVRVGPDLATRAPDGPHLMGSVGTMPLNLANLTEKVGLSRREALRLLADNPRRAIGMAPAA